MLPVSCTMKNKNLFVKIVFIAFILLLLFSLVAPAIFSQTLGAPKKESLLNGLKVLMWNDAKADNVVVKIRIHAGSAFDPQGKEGVMQLLADNIFPNEAAKDYFSEDLGGGLEIVTNYDFIQINASSKPEHFLTMLETLASAVADPNIDKETTAKLKTALLAKVKILELEPGYVADRAAAKRLFGTFPYGRPQYGTEASIKAIDFAYLIDAKDRFLSADNSTVAISGNYDRALGFRAIRRYFGAWLKSDKRVPSTFRQPEEPPTALLSVASPSSGKTAIRFAMRGLARSDKELMAAMIFTNILETRLKARVPAAHTGEIFVRNEYHTLPGMITIGFSADKGVFGASNGKVVANELVGKAIADPITEAEFQAAKAAVQTDWAGRDAISLWLDVDTFKTAEPTSKSAESTLVEVKNFAESAAKKSMVAILVNTPTPAN